MLTWAPAHGEKDLGYVRRLCDQLQVPLEIVNFQEAYWSRVVQYALKEIKAGRTPNPDIMCNKMVKLGAFFKYLDQLPGPKFDKVASGHYARVIENKIDSLASLDTFWLSKNTRDKRTETQSAYEASDRVMGPGHALALAHRTPSKIKPISSPSYPKNNCNASSSQLASGTRPKYANGPRGEPAYQGP